MLLYAPLDWACGVRLRHQGDPRASAYLADARVRAAEGFGTMRQTLQGLCDHARTMWFDTCHARETLGWRSRYSTDEMIQEAYDWFLVNRARVSQSGPSHHRSGVKQGVLRVGKAVLRYV